MTTCSMHGTGAFLKYWQPLTLAWWRAWWTSPPTPAWWRAWWMIFTCLCTWFVREWEWCRILSKFQLPFVFSLGSWSILPIDFFSVRNFWSMNWSNEKYWCCQLTKMMLSKSQARWGMKDRKLARYTNWLSLSLSLCRWVKSSNFFSNFSKCYFHFYCLDVYHRIKSAMSWRG